jgi:predicted DNA-binding transcriptional regulator YafY
MRTWQIDHRRAFIEHHVYWRGRLRLGDLVEVFGISRTQSSLDINAYIQDFPDHLVYDKSNKHYAIGPAFTPHYTSLDPSEHLAKLLALNEGAPVALANWEMQIPDIHAPRIPVRVMRPEVLRDVLRAIENGCEMEITYQSMSAPEPSVRRIAPHALASDGFRWHVRALCLRDGRFKDFVISRMIRTALGPVHPVNQSEDAEWQAEVELTIAPHSGLSNTQRKVIELDYGMENGTATLQVRKSMLYYTLKRLGLDTDPEKRRPQDQQIVLQRQRDVPQLQPFD